MNPQKLVVNHHDHHFNHEFCQLVEIIMGFQSKSWDSTNSTVEIPFSAQARLGWCLARSRRGATLDLIFDRWYRVSSGNRKKNEKKWWSFRFQHFKCWFHGDFPGKLTVTAIEHGNRNGWTIAKMVTFHSKLLVYQRVPFGAGKFTMFHEFPENTSIFDGSFPWPCLTDAFWNHLRKMTAHFRKILAREEYPEQNGYATEYVAYSCIAHWTIGCPGSLVQQEVQAPRLTSL